MKYSLLCTALVLGLTSCFKQPAPAPSPSSNFLFKFNYQAVPELLISKADPVSGDRWTARFRHLGTDAKSWEIESAPDGMALVDKKANGLFIEHLLDTFRTLQVVALAPNGDPQSFGLAQPLFAFQWKAEGTEFELRIGKSDKDGNQYAVIPKQGQGKGSEQVLILRGAAQKMLDYITSFQYLRLPTWSTVTSDDVDEIEIRQGGRKVFYAQRHQDDWANEKLKPFTKVNVGEFLDQLNHQRILAYLDNPDELASLSKLMTKPLFKISLKDRAGMPTDLNLTLGKPNTGSKTHEAQLLGNISTRPGALFVLYPEALILLQRLSR